jgi:hypothetical protein
MLRYAIPMSSRPLFQMLRRVAAFVLVFALIGYGTSWAFGGRALGDIDQSAGHVHEHTDPAYDENGCDHCCHSCAHMTGLAPTLPRAFRHQPEGFRLVPDCHVATRFCTPPLRPPRI